MFLKQAGIKTITDVMSPVCELVAINNRESDKQSENKV